MLTTTLIERKRGGDALTPDEWSDLIARYTADQVPDYQMAALLMAVMYNGLTPAELGALTDAMVGSGESLVFGDGVPPRVDKHSTGGVGDKVSLVLAPLVQACGLAIPMMSGRGLGHTGGTLDKLEAIPGFRTTLTLEEVQRQVEGIGVALFGQTPEIAPADRKLYALRDATSTVESIPLIAASIMSKKLAEGLNGLVLDVKHGSGAFLRTLDQRLELAQTMIGLGAERGCPTVALLTAMDRPLGRACGNALETEEAFLALTGEGPDDLMAVTYALGTEMLLLGRAADDPAEALLLLEDAITSGRAAEACRAILVAQGGNPRVLDDPAALPHARIMEVFEAPAAGLVEEVEPRTIGQAIVAMGGGRRTINDQVDPAVGFVITVKPGDRVERGQSIATIHARDTTTEEIARDALARAIRIGEGPADPLPLISHRVTSAGVEALA